MNLLILGASGATGQLVLAEALRRGHTVTALVRETAQIGTADGAEVARGDVGDPAVLAPLLAGKDAVISCLGIGRKNAASPWSALTSPPDFTETSARVIASAMEAAGVARIVALSAGGAGDSHAACHPILRGLFRISKLGITIADSTRMEDVYRQSALDWLAVRPARLVDGPATGKAAVVSTCGPAEKIPRADLANWLLDAVERPERFSPNAEMVALR